MKKVLLLIALFLLPICSFAQLQGIEVKMDNNARRATSVSNSATRINGYRICIYSDNTQNARVNATKILKQYEELGLSSKAKMEYDNPFFRIYTGYCLDRNEAARLLGKLKAQFPMAIIATHQFDIEKLILSTEEELEGELEDLEISTTEDAELE